MDEKPGNNRYDVETWRDRLLEDLDPTDGILAPSLDKEELDRTPTEAGDE